MDVSDGRCGHQDQPVIPGSGWYAPPPGAFEQDGVDAIFRVTDKPVRH